MIKVVGFAALFNSVRGTERRGLLLKLLRENSYKKIMAENVEVDRIGEDYSDEESEEVECIEQDVQKWSSEEVSSWLRKQGFSKEAGIFQDGSFTLYS